MVNSQVPRGTEHYALITLMKAIRSFDDQSTLDLEEPFDPQTTEHGSDLSSMLSSEISKRGSLYSLRPWALDFAAVREQPLLIFPFSFLPL